MDLAKLREVYKRADAPEIYTMDPGSPRCRVADSALHLPLDQRCTSIATFRELLDAHKGGGCGPHAGLDPTGGKARSGIGRHHAGRCLPPGNEALEKQGKLQGWTKLSVAARP